MRKIILTLLSCLLLGVVSCRKTTPAPVQEPVAEDKEFVTPQDSESDEQDEKDQDVDTPITDPNAGYSSDEDSQQGTSIIEEETPVEEDNSLDNDELEEEKPKSENIEIEFDDNGEE